MGVSGRNDCSVVHSSSKHVGTKCLIQTASNGPSLSCTSRSWGSQLLLLKVYQDICEVFTRIGIGIREAHDSFPVELLGLQGRIQ